MFFEFQVSKSSLLATAVVFGVSVGLTLVVERSVRKVLKEVRDRAAFVHSCAQLPHIFIIIFIYFLLALARTRSQVQVMTHDIRATVTTLSEMTQLPHVVRLIDMASKEDDTGFHWQHTYAMMAAIKDTAAILRDTVTSESLLRVADLAVANHGRMLEAAEREHAALMAAAPPATSTPVRPLPLGPGSGAHAVFTPLGAPTLPLNPTTTGLARQASGSGGAGGGAGGAAHHVAMVHQIATIARDFVTTPAIDRFSHLATVLAQPERLLRILVYFTVTFVILVLVLVRVLY
jgi:hypothetical protein